VRDNGAKRSEHWPHYENVVPPIAPQVPEELAASLATLGVPRNFIGKRYRLSSEVRPVALPAFGTLVQFADSALGALYLDPSNGKVISPTSADGPIIVNSSLRQFDDTVRTVIEMFPFYNRGSSIEERQGVADRMRSALQLIDPAATVVDSFWGNYIDDLEIGDFATEDVLESFGAGGSS